MQITEKASFETLCGKDLPIWKEIQESKNYIFIQNFKENYDKLYPELQKVQENKIPEVIHIIWLGPKNFPIKSIECARSWIEKHPTWKIKFWTDRDRPTPCPGMEKIIFSENYLEELQDCYQATTNWSEKADYLRYTILKKEGGVYVDHDAKCLKPFHTFHASFHFYATLALPQPGSIAIPPGLIGSIANHPFFEKTIQMILKKRASVEKFFPEKENEKNKILSLSYITFSEAIKDSWGTTGYKDMVFPTAYFWGDVDLPSIYIEHYYAGSWIAKEPVTVLQKEAFKQTQNISKTTKYLLFIQSSLIFCFGLFFVFYKRKQ